MTHFPNEKTVIKVHDHAPRGITVRASKSDDHMHLLLHNGCGRGNMRSILTNQEAIEIALALIKVAQRPKKANNHG